MTGLWRLIEPTRVLNCALNTNAVVWGHIPIPSKSGGRVIEAHAVLALKGATREVEQKLSNIFGNTERTVQNSPNISAFDL